MKPKSLEQIFDEEAQKGMIQYNPIKFRLEYPHLYKVILNAMLIHSSQCLDEAIEELEVEVICENKSFYRLRTSIRRIKAKINGLSIFKVDF